MHCLAGRVYYPIICQSWGLKWTLPEFTAGLIAGNVPAGEDKNCDIELLFYPTKVNAFLNKIMGNPRLGSARIGHLFLVDKAE